MKIKVKAKIQSFIWWCTSVLPDSKKVPTSRFSLSMLMLNLDKKGKRKPSWMALPELSTINFIQPLK